MTPLLVAGAASVARYLVDKIDPLGGASVGASTKGDANFGAVLRSASQGLGSNPAGVGLSAIQGRDLEQSLLRTPEIQVALQSLPVREGVSLDVRPDGSVTLKSELGSRELVLSEESRALARQIFAARGGALSPAVFLSQEGVPTLRLPLSLTQ